MSFRRRIDPDTDGVNVPISLKMPKSILDRIDDAWKNDINQKYTGRGHYMEEACKYFMSLEPCPKCGKLHEKTALRCSYCEETFDRYTEQIEALRKTVALTRSFIRILQESLTSINSQIEKIDWYLNKQNSDVVDTFSSLTGSIYEELKKSRDDLEIMNNIFSTYQHPTDIVPDISKFLKLNEIFNTVLPISGLLKSYPEKTFPIQNRTITVAYYHKVCEEILENHDSYRTLTINMYYTFLNNDITAMYNKYLPIMKLLNNHLSSMIAIIDYIVENSKK